MAIVYQYNANAYYIGETNAFGGSMPHNCCAVAPDVQAGFTPQWDGAAWKQVENHTSKTWDGQAQAPTHYWLPTDTWDTPARHMTEPGPLPAGALLTVPEKPLDLALQDSKNTKLSEIMAKFSALFDPINKIYPLEEQSSWAEQEADAALYLTWLESGAEGPEPNLAILPQILLPGESMQELCVSVQGKGQVFKTLRNTLQAQQRAHYHAVMPMTDPAEIEAYIVTYALPEELTAYLEDQQS